ncbi:hypothetical protein [Streptomyces sp. RTd22]|uniref:hypothetical protein n=1 Tax=Streptomyces sp. RTd22 TaxID=1841249 RepID=UPI0007C44831|nr:hypothetical protein [Streptomyces sp. RTd22]
MNRPRAGGRLGEPSPAPSAAWAAAGADARMLHDAPLPPWPGRGLDGSLRVVRRLVEHGFDPSPEVAVLRSQP